MKLAAQAHEFEAALFWKKKKKNWDCLVLHVICTLLSLHYVYILFMFVNTMLFLARANKHVMLFKKMKKV